MIVNKRRVSVKGVNKSVHVIQFQSIGYLLIGYTYTWLHSFIFFNTIDSTMF